MSAASADDGTQMPYSGHLWPGPIEVQSSADAAIRRQATRLLAAGRWVPVHSIFSINNINRNFKID